MYTTEYLYNIQPTELATMSYPDALQHKYYSAKLLIAELMEPNFMEQNDERINAVHKAIKHTEYLIQELS